MNRFGRILEESHREENAVRQRWLSFLSQLEQHLLAVQRERLLNPPYLEIPENLGLLKECLQLKVLAQLKRGAKGRAHILTLLEHSARGFIRDAQEVPSRDGQILLDWVRVVEAVLSKCDGTEVYDSRECYETIVRMKALAEERAHLRSGRVPELNQLADAIEAYPNPV